ncbi:glutaredoxin 3, partial [Pancytospora philotis]
VTRDGCPYSQRARVFLRSKGISFKDYNVDAEGADIRPLLIAKWPTFPAVFCGDKIVGGMEELGALEFEN